MNLKWTTQSLWFYIFSHTNCLVKPLHFTQMIYSHAIRPWIHSSSACIELNMLSIDLPVSREQTRGHVKVSVCVWEGEGDEKGPGRVSKSKEWERKERESSVCILDQWESERHCSSFRNTLWSNRFLPSAAFTCVFISSWFSRYSELYSISPQYWQHSPKKQVLPVWPRKDSTAAMWRLSFSTGLSRDAQNSLYWGTSSSSPRQYQGVPKVS